MLFSAQNNLNTISAQNSTDKQLIEKMQSDINDLQKQLQDVRSQLGLGKISYNNGTITTDKASCPNNCNGRGSCSNDIGCICQKEYGGPDCSRRYQLSAQSNGMVFKATMATTLLSVFLLFTF
jgi:hypothetical protein